MREAAEAYVGWPTGSFMGIFDKLLGRVPPSPNAPVNPIVLRSRELAELLARPTEPNASDAPQSPCDKCGKALAEAFITTGGPTGDPDVWRDVPIAVDGWACVSCGVFRYPRKMSPELVTALTQEGAEHGRAGRFAEAEQAFARVVWAWPGYVMGHLNYAEATRDRLNLTKPDEPLVRHRLVRRMMEHYEMAVFAEGAPPHPLAHAAIRFAELCIADRSIERGRRALDRCLGAPGVPTEQRERALELVRAIDTRLYLFAEASDVLGERIDLMGRPGRLPEHPEERKALVNAIEKLEQHLEVAEGRWQSLWLYAKALPLVGRQEDAWNVWKETFARHASVSAIGQDYSRCLLQSDRNEEARLVARSVVQHHPQDAKFFCNLAVTELLCGDLEAAEGAISHALQLDPNDPVAHAVRQRLSQYKKGRPLPRTLREMEGT